MTRNVGSFDRIARFVLGALLIALAAMGSIGAWGYLGLILVGTAFISFCPLYRIIGMKTCKEC